MLGSRTASPNSYKSLISHFLLVPIAIAAFVAVTALSSCQKEAFGSNIENMEYFYNESRGLTRVAGDSIQRFATKVETYVCKYPEERYNPYYPEIVDNIEKAAKAGNLSIVVTINTDWEGEIVINY